MTLMNGLLALGALAFTVPLAIHLLFRSRFTTIDWGAMYLLETVVRINRRRLQLMNLLLLLLRCLIPILLAFCLARPVLTGFQTLPGDAPQSLVIAVDDSRSMAAHDNSGESRMERAVQDLTQIVGQLSRRDEVIFIRASQVEAAAPSMGAQDAVGRIRDLKTDGGPLPLDRLIAAGFNAAKDAAHPQRRILIVSDFQRHNLSDQTLQSLRSLSSSSDQSPSEPGQAGGPVISFLHYGGDSDGLENVSVDAIDIESAAIVAGRGARFAARIGNAGDQTAQDVRLLWSIDGQPQPPRTISIPPDSSATDRLTARIDDAGIHRVTLSVEHADALTADNRRTLAVDVIPEINVLMVDGQPGRRPLEGETDYLAIALSPFAFGGEDLPDAVRNQVVSLREFSKQFSKNQPDILVLANVKSLSTQQQSAVAQFVLEGGALVVFDGDNIDIDSYNAPWRSDDDLLTLPARLGQPVGGTASDTSPPIPIGAHSSQYSPWGILATKDRPAWKDVEVYGYRKLTLADKRTSDDPESESGSQSVSTPLLSTASGDPLIVMARRGRGRVVQFAIPCDADWSTLPVRMVYLPMMQQLMLDLVGNRRRTTVSVGEPLSVSLAEFGEQDALAESDPDPSYVLQPPEGAESTLQPSEDTSPVLTVRRTSVPGTYRFRQTIMADQGEPIVSSTLRVVEVPAAESKLQDAEASRINLAADTLGATVYRDVESLQSDDQTRRFGREIWRFLLAALLIGMVSELFLQQRTTGKSVPSEVF